MVGILVLLSFVITQGVYVDHGNPYNKGTLPTGEMFITETGDKSPLHSIVFFPTLPGSYGLVFFVPGLNGLVLAELYSNYLTAVASHGFIVVGTDDIAEIVDPSKKAAEFMKQFLWMKSNLDQRIQTEAANVSVSWSHVTLASHSAGADGVLRMAEMNRTLFKGVVFWEPFSLTFDKPLNFSMPALIVGTELSTQGFPPCIVKGLGYNHFYDLWTTSKIVMDVKGYGHCDVLDDTPRKACRTIHFCRCANDSSIPAYRKFAQGMTSAFLISSVLGYSTDNKYVIDRANIPITLLELKYNFTNELYNFVRLRITLSVRRNL